MATDVQRLRPGELCRLLNSTPLGECLGERQLHRHRTRAGLRIGADGDPRRLNLLRYVAWLFDQRHAPAPGTGAGGESSASGASQDYDAHRERSRLRNALLSASGRDIGAIPGVRDPARRASTCRDFRRFCESYMPRTFCLAWSADHIKVIARIEESVLEGGLFALAMPRGSGKTSLCEAACLWAMLHGHRSFTALIGATEADAEARLESVRTEIEINDLLLEDFPEACFPVRQLAGINQRAAGQLCQGRQTHIDWGNKQVVLPTVEGSPSSGAIVRIAGITGRIRGMSFKRSDGRNVRPDFVVIDDCQTDESAVSLAQCRHRESILSGAVLGLAGPGRKIVGFMPCTVIAPDDMADRILDRTKHPEWQGERMRMVDAWPARMDLWETYRERRNESLRAGGKGEEATAFYLANREAMDRGARLAWPERFNPDEASALQHAFNLRFRDERAFFAEYQNEPLPQVDASRLELRPDDIVQRVNGVPRGIVPVWATRLTAFVDVQDACLWWMVCAWADDFTGAAIDYGAWPDQGRDYFTGRSLRRTLATEFPDAGFEGRIYAGLEALGDRLAGREWGREDGAATRIGRLLVDANYGKSTETVRRWCRESPHSGCAMPSHAKYVGASSMPFAEYRRKAGEQIGLNWLVRKGASTAVRHLSWDTNWWKTFCASRLVAAKGDRGAFMLFGRDTEAHRMLAEHLTAERGAPVSSRGRTVDEWKAIPGRDNHLLDCLVGCAVAASTLGAALTVGGGGLGERPPRRVIKLSEWQRGRRIHS